MEPGTIAERLVESIHEVYGRHPGARAAHAKGVLCHAVWEPSAAAGELSRAPHFQHGTRAHVRFSHGSGDPEAVDGRREPRGMAVKLYLPDGSTTDVVCLSLPFFFVRNPDDFLAFSAARRPDPATGKPDLARVGAFLERHPETMRAVQQVLSTPPPASYARLTYHGIHAFRFLGAGDDTGRFGRYRLSPLAGEATLSDEKAALRPRDYLAEELSARFDRGPAVWNVEVVLAAEGDPIDDPTEPWPPEREAVPIGRLGITWPAFDREREGDVLVFDPGRVCDGIEPSADPILAVRSDAYRVSVAQRTGGG
jgi:catalase